MIPITWKLQEIYQMHSTSQSYKTADLGKKMPSSIQNCHHWLTYSPGIPVFPKQSIIDFFLKYLIIYSGNRKRGTLPEWRALFTSALCLSVHEKFIEFSQVWLPFPDRFLLIREILSFPAGFGSGPPSIRSEFN